MQPTHSHARRVAVPTPQPSLALPRCHDTLGRLCPSGRPPEVIRARSRSRGALPGASMQAARLHPRAPFATARRPARFPAAAVPSSSYGDSHPCSRPERRLTRGTATQKLGRGLGAEPQREFVQEGAAVGEWRARKPGRALRRRPLCPGDYSSMPTRGVLPAGIRSRLRSSAPEPANLEKRLMGRGTMTVTPGQLGASIPSPRDGERETGIQEQLRLGACSSMWGWASLSLSKGQQKQCVLGTV